MRLRIADIDLMIIDLYITHIFQLYEWCREIAPDFTLFTLHGLYGDRLCWRASIVGVRYEWCWEMPFLPMDRIVTCRRLLVAAYECLVEGERQASVLS